MFLMTARFCNLHILHYTTPTSLQCTCTDAVIGGNGHIPSTNGMHSRTKRSSPHPLASSSLCCGRKGRGTHTDTKA